MKKEKFRAYTILGQIGLWLIFFMINFLGESGFYPPLASFAFALNYTFMAAGIVYLHYFGALPLYLSGKKLLYVLATLMVIVCMSSVYYIIDYNLPIDGPADADEGWAVVYNLLLMILLIAVSSIYYFVDAWFHNIETESLLRAEKLQTEINFLKSQINPHFLFNTLNNIYSYAQMGNEKTAPMLERLSSILRFMVYDCSEDRVPLVKEMDAVEDLLEIYKMKNSMQKNIELSVKGVRRYYLIAPLIIVNFVENIFKHSDAVSNQKGFISVKVVVDESDNCVLEISNSVKQKNNIETKYQGVGLENMKKRLGLQYGKKYTLKEKLDNKIYHLTLSIPLERKK